MSSPRRPPLSRWSALALAVALATGALAAGCGPQKKFCPEIPNGVCPGPEPDAGPPPPMDAATDDPGDAIFIGLDGSH
jgi:hypothetical protein